MIEEFSKAADAEAIIYSQRGLLDDRRIVNIRRAPMLGMYVSTQNIGKCDMVHTCVGTYVLYP